MNTIKEEQDTLICLKYDHNQPVKVVIMRGDDKFEDKFLCEICQQNTTQLTINLGIQQAIKTVDEKITQDFQEMKSIQSCIENLQKVQEKISSMQQGLQQCFLSMLNLIKNWIEDLHKLKENNTYFSLIDKFQHYFGQNVLKNKINTDIRQINETHKVKLNGVFNKLQNLIKVFRQDPLFAQSSSLKNKNESINTQTNLSTLQQLPSDLGNKSQSLKDDFTQRPPPIIKHAPSLDLQVYYPKVSSVKQINSVKQTNWFQAIAFNYTGQLMFAGCNKDIIVHQFDKGQLSQLKTLQGHENLIHCIVTSKTHNWFASGGEDMSIRCWKEQPNGEWLSTRPVFEHKDFIMCLVLSEDELISCSYDKQIIVWKVNSYQLDYYYKLDQKHSDQIYCISLNPLNTTLVSCSEDNTIIIWDKDKENKWKFQNKIKNDDYGYRICFIDNNLIAWQQCHKGITHIFEIQNGKLIPKPSIILDQQENDQWLFPTILNQQKQIIIQRHNKNVYILQRQVNGQLKIVWHLENLPEKSNYGALTLDGEYLVLWNYDSQEFQIYNILYDQ